MHRTGPPNPVEPIRRHLRVIRDRNGGDLEKACVHCGACCYAKVSANGVSVLVRSLRCRFLSVDATGKSRCTVYGDRRGKAPWCHELPDAIAKSILPGACPYVASMVGYTGPSVLGGPDYRAVEAALRESLRGTACPDWADPAAWKSFVEGDAT